jgi:hypothetical protein
MSDLTVSWQNILRDAITRPGAIHEAYSRFHSYSIGNQLLALMQCRARGIQPGPIATFVRWKELGRHVRKGEKALTLCMPVTCKAKQTARDERGNESEQEIAFTRFLTMEVCMFLRRTSSPIVCRWERLIDRNLLAFDPTGDGGKQARSMILIEIANSPDSGRNPIQSRLTRIGHMDNAADGARKLLLFELFGDP